MKDRRVAKIIRACQELPGQELLQYLDEEGNSQDVTSSDVNAYLREITGKDITAKDFRTWAGTVLAAIALSEVRGSTAQRKPSSSCVPPSKGLLRASAIPRPSAGNVMSTPRCLALTWTAT